MAKIGRPSIYNESLANEICRRIMDGESLAGICREKQMPSRSVVHLWLLENREFLDKYETAREIQADVYADEMELIAIEEPDVQRARLRIDTRKWISSKLKPKKYGDKVTNEQTGKDGGPIEHEWKVKVID